MNISVCVLIFGFVPALSFNVEFCLEKNKHEKTLPNNSII